MRKVLSQSQREPDDGYNTETNHILKLETVMVVMMKLNVMTVDDLCRIVRWATGIEVV